MPLKIKNHSAITSLLNSSEKKMKLTISKPVSVELINETEVNFLDNHHNLMIIFVNKNMIHC